MTYILRPRRWRDEYVGTPNRESERHMKKITADDWEIVDKDIYDELKKTCTPTELSIRKEEYLVYRSKNKEWLEYLLEQLG